MLSNVPVYPRRHRRHVRNLTYRIPKTNQYRRNDARRNATRNKRPFIYFSSEKRISEKVISLVAICLSLGLCAWQVGSCVKKYLDAPIGTEVLFEKIDSITMPTLYFCPLNALAEMMDVLKIICDEESNACHEDTINTTDIHNLHLKLSDIWANNSVQHIFSEPICPASADKTKCDYAYVNESYIDSIGGRCQMLTLAGVSFNNTAKLNELWRIRLTNVMNLRLEDPVQVYLYRVPVTDKYFIDIPFEEYRWGKLVKWKVDAVTEYRRVSCMTRPEYLDCMNDCFDQLLLKEYPANYCRLPFLKSVAEDRDRCQHMLHISQAYDWIQKFQFDQQSCKCKRLCKTTKYSTKALILNDSKIITQIAENEIVLRFYFSTKFMQLINEYFIYSGSNLLTDLAGNIGFFLGISLIGTLQYFSSSVHNCIVHN